MVYPKNPLFRLFALLARPCKGVCHVDFPKTSMTFGPSFRMAVCQLHSSYMPVRMAEHGVSQKPPLQTRCIPCKTLQMCSACQICKFKTSMTFEPERRMAMCSLPSSYMLARIAKHGVIRKPLFQTCTGARKALRRCLACRRCKDKHDLWA